MPPRRELDRAAGRRGRPREPSMIVTPFLVAALAAPAEARPPSPAALSITAAEIQAHVIARGLLSRQN